MKYILFVYSLYSHLPRITK